MTSAIELLLTRRSVVAKDLTEPGPNSKQLATILEAAHRVPDHGKIGPWRFIIFEGEHRAQFSQHLARIFSNDNAGCSNKLKDFESCRLLRAPTVIALISSPDTAHAKIPQWEQQLCLGAVGQNLLIASHALGFAAQWLTEWYSYHPEVDKLLGLQNHERVAGFFYIGTAAAKPAERIRPPLEDRTSYWK